MQALESQLNNIYSGIVYPIKITFQFIENYPAITLTLLWVYIIVWIFILLIYDFWMENIKYKYCHLAFLNSHKECINHNKCHNWHCKYYVILTKEESEEYENRNKRK